MEGPCVGKDEGELVVLDGTLVTAFSRDFSCWDLRFVVIAIGRITTRIADKMISLSCRCGILAIVTIGLSIE